MTTMTVRITFIESSLGTSPANEQIYRDFIGSKAPDANSLEQEVEALGVDGVAEKGMTVFARTDDGKPMFWDYQIRGFFKDSCAALQRAAKGVKNPTEGVESAKLKAYKKEIDGLVFVQPRKVPIELSGEMTICERPLRASTAQGERVALASSEEIPAGSTLTFRVVTLRADLMKAVEEWLDYGIFRGLSQWRNSGKGRFYYEVLDNDGNVIGGNREIYEGYWDAAV